MKPQVEARLTQLEQRCIEHGWDFGLKLETASECYWSAQLRVTEEPNKADTVDRSRMWYAVAGGTPDEVADRVLRAALADLAP